MSRDTVSITLFIIVALVALGIFIPFATGYIGDSQDDIITYTKKVEKY